MTPWPTVTSSPMIVFDRPSVMWTQLRSCTLDRAPIRIFPMSARRTQPNHTLASSPISTSPMRVALSAMKAEGAIFGYFPS